MKKVLFFIFLLLAQSAWANKTTVVFLDGGSGVDGPLEKQYGGNLRKQGYRVVTVSQYGASSLNTMIKKTRSDTALRGKVVLVCHSAGCITAQVFAAKYPEKIRKLVMIEPAIGTGSDYQATMKLMVIYYKKRMGSTKFKKFMADFAAAGQGDAAAMRRAYATAYGLHGVELTKEQLNILNPETINSFGKSVLEAAKIGPQNNKFPVKIVFGRGGMFTFTDKKMLCRRWKNSTCKTYIGDHFSIFRAVKIP